MTDMEKDDIKLLMYTAFEQAFQAQLGQLYKVYISNALSSPATARTSARNGIEGAVAAYKIALDAVGSWDAEVEED
jgi:hypothetical protein